MKIGCISNNDQCLPLLQEFKQTGHEVFLYAGKSFPNDSKRDQLDQHCKVLNIPCFKENDSPYTLNSWIDATLPEIVFVLGHRSRIIMKQLPSALKIYNIHFGKLPEYRGASPVFWQLKNGESMIGCAIHEMEETIDAGAIIWEKQIPFEEHFNWNYVSFLFSNIVTQGAQHIVQQKMKGQTPQGASQDESKAGYYHTPQLKDVLVNWKTMPAAEISSLVKACDTWNNGAITLYNGMEVKIRDAVATDVPVADPTITPGVITSSDAVLTVQCAGNTQLHIHYLSINDMVFPARFAGKYGLIKGQQFSYPSD